jgi:ABC-type spermidine/putrescine transport system permease subunit I
MDDRLFRLNDHCRYLAITRNAMSFTQVHVLLLFVFLIRSSGVGQIKKDHAEAAKRLKRDPDFVAVNVKSS